MLYRDDRDLGARRQSMQQRNPESPPGVGVHGGALQILLYSLTVYRYRYTHNLNYTLFNLTLENYLLVWTVWDPGGSQLQGSWLAILSS